MSRSCSRAALGALILSLVSSLIIGLSIGLFTGPARAAGEPGGQKIWSVQSHLDFSSKYVWRGLAIDDDPVLQPWAQLDIYGFSLNLCSTIELTDAIYYGEQGSGKGKFTELDITASYTHQFGPLYLTGGLIHYTFPNTGVPATTELFATVTYGWLISPSITVYHEVVHHNGFYGNLALTWQQELSPFPELSWLVEVKAALGLADTKHNNFFFFMDRGGLNDFSILVSLTQRWQPEWLGGAWVNLRPSIGYSSMLISDIREYLDRPDPIWFGFSVGIGY